MGLCIAQHLQAIFQPAQEQIGLAQRGAIIAGDLPGGDQRIQRDQQPPLTQRRLAAAANELQCLAQKFDFADAAGATLDVVVHLAARDFGGDCRLHLAQAVERGEVQVAAVHERAQRLQPGLTGGDIASHRACFQPGIALPVAAFALEVLIHRCE
ncbi:hypothetical protein D3C81_503100 [compost metagenome]